MVAASAAAAALAAAALMTSFVGYPSVNKRLLLPPILVGIVSGSQILRDTA